MTVTAQDPDGLSATQAMTVTTAALAGPQSDREVLEVFYDSTGGASWTKRTNWKTSAPLGEWHGVTTDPAGRVTGLDLNENGLTGLIPPALGDLASLGLLDLGRNELTGPVPAWLGNLVNLWWLDLGGNELTGPVPAALGNLVNLRGLFLWGNELTGPIPGELGSLVNLGLLDLGGNDLTGPIPGRAGEPGEPRIAGSRQQRADGADPGGAGQPVQPQDARLLHSWGLSGPLPGGLESSTLEELGLFATRTCAPTAWGDWLDTIEFKGRLCEGEPEVTIDVAVVYTQAAREEAGGTAEIEAVIDLMVAETNEAYQASGVHHRLALVARSEVQYAEAGDFRDIDRLADPSDGYMDGVHAMRDRTGADLVHLVFKHQDHPFGGVANFGRAFGLTCQHCGGGTFAHELGHNMGLRHDRYAQLYSEIGRGPVDAGPSFRLRKPAGVRRRRRAHQPLAHDNGLPHAVRRRLHRLPLAAPVLESAPELQRRPVGHSLRRRIGRNRSGRRGGRPQRHGPRGGAVAGPPGRRQPSAGGVGNPAGPGADPARHAGRSRVGGVRRPGWRRADLCGFVISTERRDGAGGGRTGDADGGERGHGDDPGDSYGSGRPERRASVHGVGVDRGGGGVHG